MSDIRVLPTSTKITVIPTADRVAVVVPRSFLNAVVVTNSVVQTGTSSSNTYTKTQTDTLLAGKANLVHTHVITDITDFDGTVMAGGTF